MLPLTVKPKVFFMFIGPIALLNLSPTADLGGQEASTSPRADLQNLTGNCAFEKHKVPPCALFLFALNMLTLLLFDVKSTALSFLCFHLLLSSLKKKKIFCKYQMGFTIKKKPHLEFPLWCNGLVASWEHWVTGSTLSLKQ